jgi:hypothetical protein
MSVSEKSENDGAGFIFLGASVHGQWQASRFKTLIMALRPSEPALGSLSDVDQNWLATALTHLIQIDQSRRVENVFASAYCIVEVGAAYFQCLAPSFGTYLRCEAASEKFVPALTAVLTPAKINQLVQEFGFTAPSYSKNLPEWHFGC